jgi:MraZ protein
MLIGEYEAKLTDKNRIAIPKKIREEFSEGLILSRGYEGCLILLDAKRWGDFENIINKGSILSLSIRDTKRFIFGGAYELELDSQGRFVLPVNLKEYAQINNDVIFIAIKDWVEVWALDIWDKKLNELKGSAGDIAEQILKINID